MRKLPIIAIALLLLVVAGWLLAPRFRGTRPGATSYSTTVQLSGSTHAAFSGYYVCDGRRVPISGVLPWSLTWSNLSRFEALKARPGDTLVVDARGGGSMLNGTAGPGSRGLRLDLEGGWSFQLIQ